MQLDTQKIIWSWAVHNIGPWLHQRFDKSLAWNEFINFGNLNEMAYIYHIHDSTVELIELKKNAEHGLHSAYRVRADYYLNFLKNVVRTWLPSLETMICVAMCDGPIQHPFLPTFSFQKLADSNQILVPDIDFLTSNFYPDEICRDHLLYDQKHIGAVFVGSTTGGLITRETLLEKTLPRLNAADYFYNKSDVLFLLPNIVQYENNDVCEALSKLPYCSGNTIAWDEQLKYRFLISIDGNGATCSRVKLALSSNSALLKYSSPYKLYYFDFLEPLVHYIPINNHSDVEMYVKKDRQGNAFGSSIATAGREFSEKFLQRKEIEFYMASVLKIYGGLFNILDLREEDYIGGAMLSELIQCEHPA